MGLHKHIGSAVDILLLNPQDLDWFVGLTDHFFYLLLGEREELFDGYYGC